MTGFPCRVALAWFCALLFLIPAVAAELPALAGRVVDNAGLLDAATEADLAERLAAFERRSSDQIVVATVHSLEGEAIESFANRLFRSWALGQSGENNSVLLLVALDDRRMRIEVGYGLEGTLTDLHSRLIIENTLVPAFRAGDHAHGIMQAVNDIIAVLEGNAAELDERAPEFRGKHHPGLAGDPLHHPLGRPLLRRIRLCDPSSGLRPQDSTEARQVARHGFRLSPARE